MNGKNKDPKEEERREIILPPSLVVPVDHRDKFGWDEDDELIITRPKKEKGE